MLDAADVIIGIGLDPVELIPAPWPYQAPVVLLGSWAIDDSTYFGDRLAGRGRRRPARPRRRRSPGSSRRRGRVARPSGTGRERSTRSEAAVPADPVGLTPQEVVTIARAAAPAGTIATVDAGAHMLAAVPLWEVDAPGELLISNGLATMGFALPAAIAAALVDPSRPVVCFTGDGGLGIALAELETVARLAQGDRRRVQRRRAEPDRDQADRRGPWRPGRGVVRRRPTSPPSPPASASAPEWSRPRTSTAPRSRPPLGTDGPSLLDVTVDPSAYPAILAAIRGG